MLLRIIDPRIKPHINSSLLGYVTRSTEILEPENKNPHLAVSSSSTYSKEKHPEERLGFWHGEEVISLGDSVRYWVL